MKKGLKISLYGLLFLIVFTLSALASAKWAGGTPERLLRVNWSSDIGSVYPDISYAENLKYDLYIPADLSTRDSHTLVLFIHGGSFNSGSKEDGEPWCKYYASKGFVTASMDYPLQKGDDRPSLIEMCSEVSACVSNIKSFCESRGIDISQMAAMGISAGGTLAMNYAFTHTEVSAIPVKLVIQVAGPTDFEPEYWSLLKKVDHIDSDADFVSLMTGITVTDEMIASGEYEDYLNLISPARLVNDNTVPVVCCYGAKDHVVPPGQKILLFEAMERYGVPYKYVEFPHSNHGMYADPDKLKNFIDISLEQLKLIR